MYGVQIAVQRAHTLRHVAGTDPVELATLLVTSVETLLPLPVLADWDEPVEADDTCSATSILPPNWKVLSLTWVLFFENVAVSHEHASAATLLTTLVTALEED